MQVRVKKKKIIAKSVLEVQAQKEADLVMTVEDAMTTVDLTDDVAEIDQGPEVPEESLANGTVLQGTLLVIENDQGVQP